MGRPKLLEPKIHIGGRVSVAVKRVMDTIGREHKWTPSQVLAIVIEESPRIKSELRKNGTKRKIL